MANNPYAVDAASQTEALPFGPGEPTNVGWRAEYWRFSSSIDCPVEIVVRARGDATYPAPSIVDLGVFDSRAWLYADVSAGAAWPGQFVREYNDDAEMILYGYNPPNPESLTPAGPGDYWSYLTGTTSTMTADVKYYVCVSSYTPGDNFDYDIQFVTTVPDAGLTAERFPAPYAGALNPYPDASTIDVINNKDVSIGKIFFSGNAWYSPITDWGGQGWFWPREELVWGNNYNADPDNGYPIAVMWTEADWTPVTGLGPLYVSADMVTAVGFVTGAAVHTSSVGIFSTGLTDQYAVQLMVKGMELADNGSPLQPGSYHMKFFKDPEPHEIGGVSNFVIDIVNDPSPKLAAFVLSANPNYSSASSPDTYLEAYPMWSGTTAQSYMTASTATPDPPKTGHAAFNYNATTGKLVVSSSASSARWDGTYSSYDFSGDGGNPWQPRISMIGYNFQAPQFLTKGYAGASYAGINSNDGTNWRRVQVSGNVGAQGAPISATLSTGQPAPDANTNYYAQTLLCDSFNNSYGADMRLSGPRHARIVHIIDTDQNETFAQLNSVCLMAQRDWTSNATVTLGDDLQWKKLDNNAILVYLPTKRDQSGNPDSRYPSSAQGSTDNTFFYFRTTDRGEFFAMKYFQAFSGA
jgi:hypothetical protein